MFQFKKNAWRLKAMQAAVNQPHLSLPSPVSSPTHHKVNMPHQYSDPVHVPVYICVQDVNKRKKSARLCVAILKSYCKLMREGPGCGVQLTDFYKKKTHGQEQKKYSNIGMDDIHDYFTFSTSLDH